jgi:PAS domain S-box-containing protein
MSDKTTIPKDKQIDLPENQRNCRSLLEKSEQSRPAVLGILKDQKKTEKRLRHLNRALRTLSECNQVLIRATDEMELLSSVCRIMVETGGYPMAWVGYVGSDEAQTIHPVAQSGCPPGLLETYRLTLADSENGQVPAGRAIQTCQPFLTRPPAVDPLHAFLQERGIRQRLVCSLSFPILVGPRAIGAMNIHSRQAKAFDSEEVALLQQLVNDLAFGIAALRTRRAHAKAEADLRLFRQLIDQSNDGIFVHDSETGRILDVNETGCRLLGYSREELLHLSPTDFDPTMQDPSRWAESLRQVRAAGSLTLETQHQRKDGTRYDVEVSVSHTTHDHTEYLIAVVRDITERKQAQAALRASEVKYAIVADNTYDWEFWLSPEGRFLYTSPSCERITGHTPAEFEADPDLMLRLIHPEDRAAFKAHRCHALKGRHQSEHEFRIVRPDGTQRWIGHVCGPARDESGRFLGVRGSNRDITERKQAEEALRESEQKFRSLAEGSPDNIIRYDTQRRLLYVNRNVEVSLGFNLSSYIAKDQPPTKNPKFLDFENYMAKLRKVIETGQPEELEVTLRNPKDELRTHHIRFVAERGNDGRIIGAIAIGRDITEHKRAEEEQIKLHKQLLQAQKMESVGRLAGGVAHDFNNMLGAIIGHTDLALGQLDPAHPLYAHLSEIRKAADRSANLTRQLLGFARKQTVTPKVLDLNETVETIFKMLRRLIGEDIELAWLPAATLWPIKADPSQIDQILANLCVNARDAITGPGRVTIETDNTTLTETYCSEHPGFSSGDYVQLSVSDDGCGMEKEILEKLFEPFFTTKEVGKGTGLGLATVYGIVKQNKGFINVYSEPGCGTTFKIYLPRHAATGGPMQQDSPALQMVRGHETILLVEDEPSILSITMLMLEKLGYRVLAAATPGEAIRLAKAQAGEIHLLITDVVMPHMNGQELAKNLHSLYPGIRALFMSGYTGNVVAHHGVLEEGVLFLQKPFTMQALAAKTREALDRK